ncbi:MAG: septum site-determining protein MinC [Gammaproteobacteria bacterium]|nr:septum site-determining protein MinC [Gammaproteobacteria bacterium]
MPRAADLRFVQLGALSLRPNDLDPAAIVEELKQRKERAPELMSQARLVLDISQLAEKQLAPDGLEVLADQLAQSGFALAGLVAEGPAAIVADTLGLPVLGRASELKALTSASAAPPSQNEPSFNADAPAAPRKPTTALRHEQPIRSGQQIYARDRDLVIEGSVSAGAEVIADGSVHVYGSLRGRALAGASGDESARVYSLDFHAELVAVAGLYKLFEELPEALRGTRVQARLERGQLKLTKL